MNKNLVQVSLRDKIQGLSDSKELFQMHLSHLQEHLLNITMRFFHLQTWNTNKNINTQHQCANAALRRGNSQDSTPYWFFFFSFHTRLLLEILLNTDCLPYLPYILYSRSKGWLTLLLSDTIGSHLWTWAGCSNTREHRPRSNTVPLGSGALLKH